MTSIAPYSKPKRRVLDKKALKFKTAKLSYVYAPISGRAVQVKKHVVIKTRHGFVHKIYNVRLTKPGQVWAGQKIGVARGRRIYYRRYNPDGKQVDALVAITRQNGPQPKRWIPGVDRKFAFGTAGVMGPGHESVVVWHTSESPTDRSAIYGVVDWVRKQQSEYTLVWNPYTGQLIQLFPANVGARAMLNDGSYPTNRHGRIRIQVCVIGRSANNPLSSSPMKNRRKVMEWIDSWGVPRKSTVDHSRSRSAWERSGHTTHRSAPGNDHTDPGKINFRKLFAP